MVVVSISLILSALIALATPPECATLEVVRPIEGHLLVSFSSRQDGVPTFACLVEGTTVSPVVAPTFGTFRGVNWGVTPHELLMSACDPWNIDRPRCHIERMTLDGALIRTYPHLPVREFEEPDGRLSAGGAAMPHASPTGELIAAAANGRSPALLRASDGKYIIGLTKEYSDWAWSPDGTVLAFTRSPDAERSSLQESQVFLYDLSSGSETQLTHFGPKDYRPWWNPFAKPVVRPPVVSGLSWARRADIILFYLVPDRGVFLWNSKGEELHRLNGLEGECWRYTQLSADGKRIVYLAATRPELCLLNGGDEIRIVNSDGTDDSTAIRLRDDHWVISDIDWLSD